MHRAVPSAPSGAGAGGPGPGPLDVQLLQAIAGGPEQFAADILTSLGLDALAVSPQALLLAAVTCRRAPLVALLLQLGTSPLFVPAQLEAGDWQAFASAGLALGGLQQYSPLALAVRQLDLQTAGLLLAHGDAGAPLLVAGRPILLHLWDGVVAAATANPLPAGTPQQPLPAQWPGGGAAGGGGGSGGPSSGDAVGGGGGVDVFGGGFGAAPQALDWTASIQGGSAAGSWPAGQPAGGDVELDRDAPPAVGGGLCAAGSSIRGGATGGSGSWLDPWDSQATATAAAADSGLDPAAAVVAGATAAAAAAAAQGQPAVEAAPLLAALADPRGAPWPGPGALPPAGPAGRAGPPGAAQAAAATAAAAPGQPAAAAAALVDPGGELQGLEEQLQLLLLLLRHGADPLQPSLGPQAQTFLQACNHPAMLRLAVNHVRDQSVRGGRQLSAAEAGQLVDAAARAYLGGF